MEFKNSKLNAIDLVVSGKQVVAGKSLSEAGVYAQWIVAYRIFTEMVDLNRRYGLSRYPYEVEQAMVPLIGGFFDYSEIYLRKGLDKHTRMRVVA